MLVGRLCLGVSPATIRNDMAPLEEGGYIAQPHTSAGRIPTDKGYRLFVDRLSTVKPLSAAEKRGVATPPEGAIDLAAGVRRSRRPLAQLAPPGSIVQYPAAARCPARHIARVTLGRGRVLVVLILSTGRVEQRVVELPHELDEDQAADLRSRLNRAVVGQRLADASAQLAVLPEEVPSEDRGPVALVVAALVEAMSDQR